MIKVSNLTKTYDGTLAIDNLNFEIKKGEVVCLLGPNGAGKTTTMNILTCYLPPTSGTAELCGFDIKNQSIEVRKRVGYLPEDNPLYDEMSVYEYLNFIAELRGFVGNEKLNRLKEVTEICALKEVISKDIGQLSRGYKQRVGFAQAIFHSPDILIMDEPTAGLDPNQTVEIRELIKKLKLEKTLLISTHILSEAQAIADRVMIINKGRIVADGTKEELSEMVRGRERIYIKLEVPSDEVINSLITLDGVENVKVRDREDDNIIGYEVETKKGLDIRKSLHKFVDSKGWSMLELHREVISLEDIFRQLTEENVSSK